MDPEKYYARLVRDLDGWTSASRPAPGRIRVSVPLAGDGPRRVVIVMTPAQWVDMFSVMHGSVDSAFDRVKQILLGMEPHEHFAVYDQCSLEPSITDALPEPVLPEPGSGHWYLRDRTGVERRMFP